MATDYDAYDAILHHIFRETQGDAWFKPLSENLAAGVCLRVSEPTPPTAAAPSSSDPSDPALNPTPDGALTQPTAKYRVFPYENLTLAPFEAAVRALNPVVAVKVRSAAVHAALATVTPTSTALFINTETRIQILDTMARLPRADKEQCAAFIRDERVLVVWSDALDTIIGACRDFQNQLDQLVMRALSAGGTGTPGVERSDPLAPANPDAAEKSTFDSSPTPAPEKQKKGRSCWGFGYRSASKARAGAGDVEKTAEGGGGRRKVVLLAPFYSGLGCAMSLFFMGSGLQVLLEEWRLDNDYSRFALCATMPFLFCVSLFFSLQIIANISFVIGPVAQYHENTKYYSALRPPPNRAVDENLPHITIQMPVYKESLEQTITPSVESLKKAIQTYARQGGTSSIFINDDGMQLISPAERAARQAFYAQHGIGWVARPKHDPSGTGFVRAGRFKKASNMNYGLALSLKVEKFVLQLLELREREKAAAAAAAAAGSGAPGLGAGLGGNSSASSARSGLTGLSLASDVYAADSDMDIEERALQLAIEETYEETGKQWKPWASNGRAIRMGEIVLIVDSDTIVPEDCLRDAARELAESPEVAIIQHESDVMQVAHHWFENGIAHFTRRINKCISMACANGEVAPFVGHNAFLRWAAIQDAAFVDKADGVKKIWSEANVSEDFDMALRLMLKGYIIRWATYSNGGFKEGVSLTVDDELNRWEKYAYGCNELIFNPLINWWNKGPINWQLNHFMWSDAPLHYKVGMMSYMFSYYGIAAGVTLSVANYLLLGFSLSVDAYYLHSFEIWLACTIVFPCAGNVAFTVMQYRLGHRDLYHAFLENITWVPFFFFFFGGLGLHLSTALLAHLFSYNMTWQATKKEVERSNFFIEGPRILRRFWLSFVVSFLLVALMILLSTDAIPPEWQIPGSEWAVIFPMAITAGCHILFPIVLNPWLMIFSY